MGDVIAHDTIHTMEDESDRRASGIILLVGRVSAQGGFVPRMQRTTPRRGVVRC